MADSDDEADTVAHPRMSLRTVLGGLLDTEELAGLEDDNEAVAEMLGDLGDVGLDDDACTDDTPAIAVSTTGERVQAAIQRQAAQAEVRRRFGFSAAIKIDEVDISETPSEYAWLTDPKWANSMSETGRVHAAIRKAIDMTSRDTPPPMGHGNVYDVPNSIDGCRLPRWVSIAPRLQPSNTVSTVHTGCQPNQERLAANQLPTTFNPNSFAANKLRGEDSTGLLFRSGSGVIAGARGQMPSALACYETVLMLLRMDMMPFECKYQLQNIVCNARCFPINLEALSKAYPMHARFEETRFPGLVFRFGHGVQWVFIFFPSGNVIGTGFPCWTHANIAWRWIFSHVLVEFRDSNPTTRETAATKKNRAFNDDAVFLETLRVIRGVGIKRACAKMLSEEADPVQVKKLRAALTD